MYDIHCTYTTPLSTATCSNLVFIAKNNGHGTKTGLSKIMIINS